MVDELKKILNKIDADYADIRYEKKKDTTITMNGTELSRIGTNSTDGYVIRVLKNGGLSAVSFTKPEDGEKAIKTALENAILISKHIEKPVELAETKPVKDTFSPVLNENPGDISLIEKLETIKRYNSIALQNEKIVMTNIGYLEVIREKYFVSSEGAEIKEDLVTTRLSGLITSKDGNLTQNVIVTCGGGDGFHTIRNQETYFEKRAGIALDLLKAKSVKAGIHNCIIDPDLAGVFAHEAFGHFSEADIIETLPSMREKMKIGALLGNEVVTIIDNATIPGQLGFYKYDDEGIPVREVVLMEKGIIKGRLHSRRTAAGFKEPVTGHCVAQDYRYAPIIRMGTIYIQPGLHKKEDLFDMLDNGLYICETTGGQTAGENFTFGAQFGYEIKNGKRGDMIRDINISGNLYQTLKDIRAVGNDLVLTKIGGCGKGQTNIRSCHGGPHVLIDNLVTGGV